MKYVALMMLALSLAACGAHFGESVTAHPEHFTCGWTEHGARSMSMDLCRSKTASRE